MKFVQIAIKRAIDVIISPAVLFLPSLIVLIIAMVVLLTSLGLILFRQTRVGKDGRLFTCYKFRTMYVNAPDIRNPDGSTFNAEDDPRVTRRPLPAQEYPLKRICKHWVRPCRI
jgi:lipopolysaccharide/colanic/teichoic acid biosynthesis glycosyltransferase